MKNKEFKLPRKFTEKWLKALRSGEYNQTKNKLYNPENNGFCCLGVACKMEYPLYYLKNKKGKYACVIEKGAELFNTVVNLYKIPNELKGSIHKNDLVRQLTILNDKKTYTFEQIANWIEKNVEFYD